MMAPTRTDVIAAMQAAILADNWRLANDLGAEHLDGRGWTRGSFCRWCGAAANGRYYRWPALSEGYRTAVLVPLCVPCAYDDTIIEVA